MAAVSDRCGIHFYAHPDPKIKKPVKCECMKHETTSSDHHYKAGGRVGSDAVFMTSDQLKKKRAFSKMFLPNYKNRYNMAIKSLNIPEESCYKCCQKFHDEMKESFAARNNEAQKTDKDGKLIDPYGGKKDIEAKILKHVSESFFEDPLRALRVARFYAQFEDFSELCSFIMNFRHQKNFFYIHLQPNL